MRPTWTSGDLSSSRSGSASQSTPVAGRPYRPGSAASKPDSGGCGDYHSDIGSRRRNRRRLSAAVHGRCDSGRARSSPRRCRVELARAIECGLSLVPLFTFHQGTTAGPWVGAEQDRIELWSARRIEGTSPLVQLRASPTPALVVERLDCAADRIERQAGKDLRPSGDSFQVVGQFRDFPEDPRPEPKSPVRKESPSGLKATV